MKPVTYDFDVITDAPAPKSRQPEAAEKAPQADADKERRGAAPPNPVLSKNVQAAEWVAPPTPTLPRVGGGSVVAASFPLPQHGGG